MAKLAKIPYTRETQSLEKYLREISEVKLLTAEEEVDLAQKIRMGSHNALQNLTKANLRFVVSVAKQYQNQGLSLADLINEGNIGLIKAAKRFDETKGFKFISYAVWWIRQAILQALADQSRIIRLPLNRVGALHRIGRTSSSLEQEFGRSPTTHEIADDLEMKPNVVADNIQMSMRHLSLDAPFQYGETNTLLDLIENTGEPAPDTEVLKSSLKQEVEKALSSLTSREARVLCLYYGINRDRPLTLEEIGKEFKLTRERVRQIKDKALHRLRHPVRCKPLIPYIT